MRIIVLVFNKCASGSVGRARPCQGRGRGFEPRLALFYIELQFDLRFFFFVSFFVLRLGQSLNHLSLRICVLRMISATPKKQIVVAKW